MSAAEWARGTGGPSRRDSVPRCHQSAPSTPQRTLPLMHAPEVADDALPARPCGSRRVVRRRQNRAQKRGWRCATTGGGTSGCSCSDPRGRGGLWTAWLWWVPHPSLLQTPESPLTRERGWPPQGTVTGLQRSACALPPPTRRRLGAVQQGAWVNVGAAAVRGGGTGGGARPYRTPPGSGGDPPWWPTSERGIPTGSPVPGRGSPPSPSHVTSTPYVCMTT